MPGEAQLCKLKLCRTNGTHILNHISPEKSHLPAQHLLQGALLPRRQLVIKDDGHGAGGFHRLYDLQHLAAADVAARADRLQVLVRGAHHLHQAA